MLTSADLSWLIAHSLQLYLLRSAVGSVGPQRYEKMRNFTTEMNIKVKLQIILVGIDILKIILKIWHYHSRDVTSDVMKLRHIFF